MTDLEEYRRQLAERFKREKREAVAEVHEAAAKASAKDAKASAGLERVRATKILPPDVCKRCFFEHGRTSLLRPMPSDTDVDLFRCAVCDEVEERQA